MEGSREKPLAVLTGASSGIGYELAAEVAQQGFDALTAGKGRVVAGSLKNREDR